MKGIILQKKYNLTPSELLSEFDKYNCEVSKDYMNCIYEFACLTAEFQGINPYKATNFIEYIMVSEMSKALNLVRFMRFNHPNEKMNLIFPNKNNIEDIVKKEHGYGIPINKKYFKENEINLKTSMFHY